MKDLIDKLARALRIRSVKFAVIVVMFALIGAGAYSFNSNRLKPPPSIFDTAVDDVLGYLIEEDFSKLTVQERLNFIADLMKRFGAIDQSESVAASSFLAGLTGPASEKLVQNARVLGKDIFVQGAAEYLALNDEKERDAYLDQWIIKWIRFGHQLEGRTSSRSDEELLDRLSQDAKRDLEQGIEIDAKMAQRVTDFWQRDIASVTTPTEQAQIFQFGPALRKRMVDRFNAGK